MRLVIVEGPSLRVLDFFFKTKKHVGFTLHDHTSIVVRIDDIVWDDNPKQIRALIRGRIIGGTAGGDKITGYFNAVGAGLFDTVEEFAHA